MLDCSCRKVSKNSHLLAFSNKDHQKATGKNVANWSGWAFNLAFHLSCLLLSLFTTSRPLRFMFPPKDKNSTFIYFISTIRFGMALRYVALHCSILKQASFSRNLQGILEISDLFSSLLR